MSINEGLKRKIGLWGLVSNNINITVGAGIFLLPVIIARQLGTASILAYLVCGILIMLIMMCFAEVGSVITRSGGPYSYIEEAFGSFAGFLTTNIFIFGGAVMSNAAVANGLADTLAYYIPLFDVNWFRVLFFFLMFGGFAIINVVGVSQAMKLVNFNTVAKLTPLLLIALLGWVFIKPENLQWEAMPRLGDIGEMSMVLIFAFIGGETALNVSGEIKNPARTIPRGILLSVLGIVILYILIQYTVQGVLGDEMGEYADAPLAEAAFRMIGPLGASIVIIGTSFAMFGNLSGMVLNMSRVLFASARDRVIKSRALASVHPRYATPWVSVIVYASLGFIFATVGEFKQLALLSGSSYLLIYLGVVLSVIKFRIKGDETGSGRTFRVPGGYTIPIISVVAILWFLSSLPGRELMAMLIFLCILTLAFFILKLFSPIK
ncbi:MAG: APC family permease [Marinilabiliaceae bacterium]|jgi:amino acid transporter|nr:APC family permease [Marinilabiliaceae bacterium]